MLTKTGEHLHLNTQVRPNRHARLEIRRHVLQSRAQYIRHETLVPPTEGRMMIEQIHFKVQVLITMPLYPQIIHGNPRAQVHTDFCLQTSGRTDRDTPRDVQPRQGDVIKPNRLVDTVVFRGDDVETRVEHGILEPEPAFDVVEAEVPVVAAEELDLRRQPAPGTLDAVVDCGFALHAQEGRRVEIRHGVETEVEAFDEVLHEAREGVVGVEVEGGGAVVAPAFLLFGLRGCGVGDGGSVGGGDSAADGVDVCALRGKCGGFLGAVECDGRHGVESATAGPTAAVHGIAGH